MALLGDLFWHTTNNQLKVYNGSSWTTIGPLSTTGSGQSGPEVVSITDTGSVSHVIVKMFVNDVIVSIEFTIDSTDAENAISGYDVIRAGVTLKNTTNNTNGVTSSTQRFHGTATNSEKLGGVPAINFVTTSPGVSSVFTELVNFQTDTGIAIGAGLDLKLYIENDNQV